MNVPKKKRKVFGYKEALEYFKDDGFCLATSEYNRKQRLKNEYGLTLEDYEQMLKIQGGVCAICKEPETNIDKRTNKLKVLSVDHHHESKRVRGLLCTKCNTGLGMFRDDSQLLLLAAEYLKNN